MFCFVIAFQWNSKAQNRSDKVESIKIAFLSQQLHLDPKTAERFWPIYNQYDEEMHQVLRDSRKANDQRSVEDILDQEQRAIDIKRRYSVLFLKVISNEQLSKLYQAEHEFNRMLIRRMNRMENKKRNPNQDERFRRHPGLMRRNGMRDNNNDVNHN